MEKFEFKDNKMRWTVSDLNYLFKKTAGSRPEPLEELENDKRKEEAIDHMNNYIAETRQYYIDKIKVGEDSKTDDW